MKLDELVVLVGTAVPVDNAELLLLVAVEIDEAD